MKKILLTLLLILFVIIPVKLKAESFTWPSDGYLGWRFYDDTNQADQSGFPVNIGGVIHYMHTGIDIWSNADGLWNGHIDGNSNPVYAVYPGTVFYRDYQGIQIKHSNTLYTNYWHIKNITVNVNDVVDANTLVGYQDMAATVHVHLTVTTAPMQGSNHDNTGAFDPTSYFGVNLDVRNNAVNYGTQVKRNSCGGSSVSIANQNISGNFDCAASISITVNPTTTFLPNSGTIKLHAP